MSPLVLPSNLAGSSLIQRSTVAADSLRCVSLIAGRAIVVPQQLVAAAADFDATDFDAADFAT